MEIVEKKYIEIQGIWNVGHGQSYTCYYTLFCSIDDKI